MENINTKTLKVGDRVTTSNAFTSPTGIHFKAGDAFIINLVGGTNTRAHAERCGSIVWIASGSFIPQEKHAH